MIVNIALVLVNVVLLVLGQTFWKLALAANPISMHFDKLLKLIFSLYFMLGIGIYGIATILWVYILSRLPLSLAYPLQSIAYVLALFVAFYFFHESIPLNRWIGTLIILAGIAVVSLK